MKPNAKYIKNLLVAFEESPCAYTDLEELQSKSWVIDEKFLFHMRLLEDQGLVEGARQDRDLGYSTTIDGQAHWSVAPIRLTAAGHDFAASLGNKAIFDKAKTTLATSGLAVTMELTKLMAIRYAKDTLGLPLGE